MTPLAPVLVAVLGAANILGCVLLVWLLGKAHSQSLAVAERAAAADRELLTTLLDQEREARKESSSKYAEILNKMSEDHANELRQVMNMKALGVPEAGPATVIPQKDDAETRVGKMVREHSIETGARQIVKRYEEAGLHIELKDAREQAAALLDGRPISV